MPSWFATDAEEVAAVARSAGISAVLTRPEHESGTDRVAEVARRAEYAGFDIVVNIQGDEPFLTAAALDGRAVRWFARGSTSALPPAASWATPPGVRRW
jgi:3-deoxy-manno-octulosonate cytidylyltransferase (CMP-KDO synthetase)